MKARNGIYFYNCGLLNGHAEYSISDSNANVFLSKPNMNLCPCIALLLTNWPQCDITYGGIQMSAYLACLQTFKTNSKYESCYTFYCSLTISNQISRTYSECSVSKN